MTDEAADLEDQATVEHALAGGDPQRVGWFRFYFDDERWEWSPQVERMHGYPPGAVDPTTDLVLSHKHPDDYGQVAATLDEIRRTSGAFSTRHRIIDSHGEVHHVVVVADQLFDDSGAVVGTHGFYVDVTPSMHQARTEFVSEAVAQIAEARGVIEQAKGMLMLIYRINADAAFELLKWRSQETNTKLRVLAEQITEDFLDLSYDETLPARSVYDRLLLTALSRPVLTFARDLAGNSWEVYRSPDELRPADANVRDALRFGVGVAAAGVAFLVLAAVWVSTCIGATADALACGAPQRALLAVGAPAIFLIGGLLAFVRTYQSWRRGQTSWAWHSAGWFLLTMTVIVLELSMSPVAGPVMMGR